MPNDELAEYDYELPAELLAKRPNPRRDGSRLLQVNRGRQELNHLRIDELPGILTRGDCLVLNDTRVLPARLFGFRQATGGKWEGLFLNSRPDGLWTMLSQSRGKIQVGESIVVRPAHAPNSDRQLLLNLQHRAADGVWLAGVESQRSSVDLLDEFGSLPLPPYIGRKLADDDDSQRYQTTYAQHPGAIAAPTAGLHFTPQLLSNCASAGIEHAFVTLHVGIGTFRPITARTLDEHRMHQEWCRLTADVAERLKRVRTRGGRIVAVGTTAVRTLETASRTGELQAFQGETDIFIRPPYGFHSVDALLTNFHLPRSSLLLLVAALAGTQLMHRAYAEAIEHRYRFYSYGDAMLIV
ncbi:MAG: tRNA preQ1(34) S-adenosylmethionine ribosyltransferase-isomerase QueA [Planctomycetaceae bacterium]